MTTTRNHIDNNMINTTTIAKKQIWKNKNDSIGIASDKLRSEYGCERETLKEKMNIF